MTNSRSRKKLLLTTLSILSILGYGFFVFAAPPGPGGYNPGETLDPECTPGQLTPNPCIVKSPLVTANNGLTATGSNVQLGGTLLQNTTIDQDGNDFSLIKNPETQLYSGSSTPGMGFSGIGFSHFETDITSFIGLMQDVVPVMGLSANTPNGQLSRVLTMGEPSGIELVNQLGNDSSQLYLFNGYTKLSHRNNSTNTFAGINIYSKTGLNTTDFSIEFETEAGSYVFPRTDGTANQVLTTNGSGQLSWTTPSGGGSGLIGSTSGLSNTPTPGSSTETWLGDSAGLGASNDMTVFIGFDAGDSAANAYNSIAIGQETGAGATYATRSVFLGNLAGAQSGTNSNYDGDNSGQYFDSNFIGYRSGFQASNADNSNFFGYFAGYQSTNARNSNFMGNLAGANATGAAGSNFFGLNAGQDASAAARSNFIGWETGYQASGANDSNFIGTDTGGGATHAAYSNFIGTAAGNNAINADSSNFFGRAAGIGATNAANSVFIGYKAGQNDTVNNTAAFDDLSTFINSSILIGYKTSTNGNSNSIALGAYATNTATNQMMVGSSTRRINSLVFNGGTGNTCSINASTGITCSSDERLKTNITDLGLTSLEKMLLLKTVTYNWKTDPDGPRMIGFIAQNLQEQFPELVTQNIDGMLSVNYAGMAPVIVESIREMNLNVTMLSDMNRPNTWRDALIAWFENAANGIRSIVVHDKICVEDQCLNKDDIRALLQIKNGQTPSVWVPGPEIQTPSNSDLSDPGNTPTDTGNPGDSGSSTPSTDPAPSDPGPSAPPADMPPSE